MNEWKNIKLKEVIKEVSERNKGQKVKRVLSITNSQGFVNQEEYFEGTVHSADISQYKIVRKNQFAYNPSRVNVGSIDILKDYDEGALSPMYVIFEVDTEKLLPEYFKYYFQTHRFYENVKNNTQGSVRNSLSFKALADFEYLLPPIEEQEKIVKILKNIDFIINKYEKLLEEKDKFIKSLFSEMFEKLKNYEKIGDICTVKARIGWQGLTRKEYLEDGEYHLVTGIDFKGNKIDFDKCYYVTKQRYEQDENIQLKLGDVLVTKDGTIGKVALIEELKKPATLNSGVFVVRDKKNKLIPKYLKSALLTANFENFINSLKTGSTIAHLNQAAFLKYKIPVPPIEKQKNFEIISNQIDKQKIELEKLIANYKTLKKGLMQRLLTGKVKVNV